MVVDRLRHRGGGVADAVDLAAIASVSAALRHDSLAAYVDAGGLHKALQIRKFEEPTRHVRD